MPVLSEAGQILATCLGDKPFLFVETTRDDTQDLVEHVVREFCVKKHAAFADTLRDSVRLRSASLQNPENVYVVYIRNWQQFTGNQIMVHFNDVFEADLRRNGPDAWCPPSQQHQAISFPGGIDAGQAFKNVKLVFSGTSEPMKQDPGLCSRLEPYKVTV